MKRKQTVLPKLALDCCLVSILILNLSRCPRSSDAADAAPVSSAAGPRPAPGRVATRTRAPRALGGTSAARARYAPLPTQHAARTEPRQPGQGQVIQVEGAMAP